MKNTNSRVVVDLFCGAGGFSRGFKEIGFTIIFGIDNDSACARSFKMNFPESVTIVEDIKEISGDDISYFINRKHIDIVIGGPPCEPFTGANPRRYPDPLDRLYKDPIGRLTLEFIRLVGELKPRIFVMENVPAIMDNGLKNVLISEFKSIGYRNIYFNILRAEDYGVPSHRVRVFISNVRIKPRKLKKRITVMEALAGLPEPGSEHVPNHDLLELSPRKLRKISKVRWGRSLYLYEGARGRRFPNYIKLSPHRIAPTVLGSSRFIHPFENRLLTVREQARLMGFPDDHIFLGGRDQQYNQVGEAVPPPLAKAIALYISQSLY